MAQQIPLVYQGNRIQQLQSGDSLPTGLTPGRRNCILNGNFDIWQSGTSFASPANNAYSCDMWKSKSISLNSGTITISREATILPTIAQSSAFSTYSLKVACTASATVISGTILEIAQWVEGPYFQFVAQRSMTLSFWVYSNLTGIYCINLRNGGGNRSYIAEYTINSANTWEKKTINVLASPSGGAWSYGEGGTGLIVSFALSVGSGSQSTANSWLSSAVDATSNQVNFLSSTSNVFYLSQVQLEQGDSASVFGDSPNALFNCQRYYYKTFPNATAPAQNAGTTSALAYRATISGATAAGQSVQFPNPMALVPTMTYYNPSSANAKWRNVTNSSDSGTATTDIVSTRAVTIQNPGSADMTGNLLEIHLTADARL